MLTANECKIFDVFADLIPKMSEIDKNLWLAYGQGLADAKSVAGIVEDAETSREETV